MATPSVRCYECGCSAPQNPAKLYCMSCGHRAERHPLVCGACAEPLGDAPAFCEHCGAPIERADAPAVAEPLSSPAPTASGSATPNRSASSEPEPEPAAFSGPRGQHACKLCGCTGFQPVAVGLRCGACGHESAAHNLTLAGVAELRRRAVPVGVIHKPVARTPQGLIGAAWIAGIFAGLSLLFGIAGYANSTSDTNSFGQSATNAGLLIGGIGIGAFWFMVCVFCVGLHGHLDRLARIALAANDTHQGS
jgi:hypothetical protein